MGIVLLAGTARADEGDRWSRRFVLGGSLDFPLATAGAFAFGEIAPVRWVSLEVGVGAPMLLTHTPSWLAMLHAQMPVGAWAPGVEAGALLGPLDLRAGTFVNPAGLSSNDEDDGYTRHLSTAVFGRVGATAAWRSEGGWFQLRFHLGATALFNGGSAQCTAINPRIFNPRTVDCAIHGIGVLPYVGVSVGVPFDF